MIPVIGPCFIAQELTSLDDKGLRAECFPSWRRFVLKAWFKPEENLAVGPGMCLVALALPTAIGIDLLGWLAGGGADFTQPGRAAQ